MTGLDLIITLKAPTGPVLDQNLDLRIFSPEQIVKFSTLKCKLKRICYYRYWMIYRLILNLCSWSAVIGQRSLRLPLRHYAASFSSGPPAPRLRFRSSFAVENPSFTVVWPGKRLLCSSRWCWKRILSSFCVEVQKEQASGERCRLLD